MKTIGITGGTGFVGQHLTRLLVGKGYDVVIFSRDASKRPSAPHISYAHWDAEKGECDQAALGKINCMMHLAGAGVADKRWTAVRKKEIVDSRVQATRFLTAQLAAYAPECKTFIAASAIGIYGPDKQENGTGFTEDVPPYNDFLADTCRQWEAESAKAGAGARVVIIRIGIVLGKEGGAFPKFSKPLSFGLMPILGSGRQAISWVHVDDLARLFMFAMEHDTLQGIYNAVAPNPATQKQLMKTIATVKGGLAIPVPAPGFVLKIALGQMAAEILKSCKVSAAKTLAAGFKFCYPELEGAVREIMGC